MDNKQHSENEELKNETKQDYEEYFAQIAKQIAQINSFKRCKDAK